MNLHPSGNLPLIMAAALFFGFTQWGVAQPTNDEERFLVLGEFKFPPSQFGVFLPVTYKNGLFLFLLDTGCSMTMFDSAFQPELGAPLTNAVVDFADARGLSNTVFRAPAAFLGNLSLQTPEPVLCANLEQLRRVSGLHVAGIIGVSFLRQYFVLLDFENNQASFLRRKFAPLVAPSPSGPNPSPFYTPADLPTGRELFMLDSGDNGFGAIAPATFDELVRLGKLKMTGTNWSTSAVRREQNVTGQMDVFKVAGQEHHNVVFQRSDPSRLGYAFLTNYNWHLDFPGTRMGSERRKISPSVLPTARSQPEASQRKP